MSLAVDLKDGFPTDFSKEFNISRCFTNPFYLKGSKYKLKDFPVFLYEHKTKRKIHKLSVSVHNNFRNVKNVQRKISNSVLQNDINSQVSYIFFNLDNSEKDLLNIFINDDILSNILNTELPKSSDEKFGFRNIIKDYIFYVSNILSKEIKKSDEEYKSKIIKNIHNEFDIYGDNISKGIHNFIIYMLKDYKRDRITVDFSSYLDKMINKLSLNQLEDIGMGFNKCKNADAKCIFISRFKREYNFKYIFSDDEESIFSKEDDWSSIENFKEDMADAAVDRYHMLLINEYIYIKNYTPKYFNNLFSEARKYIKDNLKGKKYDNVQTSRCAFLLAAMMSFKNYINNCLSEVSDDFNKYFQIFNNSILQMCCIPINENIDNATALSEFTEFLTLQIDNGSIIDRSLGIDSKFGWIDRKTNKILLKNSRANNFYDEFIKYLIDRHKRYELSKQAFVRDVLEERGILSARYANGVKRYDRERKIGNEKYRVLVLDCDLLGIH